VTNEEVLEHIREKKTHINIILSRKVNLSDYILRRNCLLYYDIERQITEVKGV
jgi:hypothetical protein